jgi:hypothetical protein
LFEPHPRRPVAALGDVLIHALRCLPFRESLIMVECAVGRGDMTLDFLRQRLPGTRNGRARDEGARIGVTGGGFSAAGGEEIPGFQGNPGVRLVQSLPCVTGKGRAAGPQLWF